ncbi:DUF4190 domain-containing protein [Virgibacillus sp. W0430]|uniref:DUF4190 domain-containing protein n=1 Tax=Virgibacillus sp. W0430 TaxID=3391580 RepID=UPI003F45F863
MENKQTNTNSIIALIVGILSILIPIIGLLLGIIGIVFSRKATKEMKVSNELGSGMATAGLICSIVGIILSFFAIIGIILFFTALINMSYY